MSRYARVCAILLLGTLGAGCTTPIVTPKTAEPLTDTVSERFVQRTLGYGALPALPIPERRASVTINAPIPDVPGQVTVIRLKRGAPNDTELRNIGAAIGIPHGVSGSFPIDTTLELAWTSNNYRWTYRSDERAIEFTRQNPPSAPLTTATLPTNPQIITMANAFLLDLGIDAQTYRSAVVEPDWNNWWLRAKGAGLCMDIQSLSNVRAIASSVSLVAGSPPPIPLANTTTCVTPEFPTKAVVRYRAFVDERDVYQADGKFVHGIELVIDVSSGTVLGGRIALYDDADRSDYPGLSPAEARAFLEQGGISPITGVVTLTAVELGSYRLEDSSNDVRNRYLVPALIGTGARVLPSGLAESVRIVAPLLKQ